MQRFGQFTFGLLVLIVDVLILMGLLWLSHNCPFWMTMIGPDNARIMSPVVWIAGIVLGAFLTFWACIVTEQC